MVTNPMQRKARNSFLLGMVITLLITGCIIALLFMQITKMKKEEEKIIYQDVVVLNQDVKSGQILTDDMFETIRVNQELVPANAYEDYSEIASYFLEDEEGNYIRTLSIPLKEKASINDTEKQCYIESYRGQTDNIQEVYTDKETGKTFMMLNGARKEVQSNNILSDEDGDYICLSEENAEQDDHIAVYQHPETGKFYRYKLVRDTDGKLIREDVDMDVEQKAMVAKVNMTANTPVTLQFLAFADEQVTNDLRKVEINTVLLPANIEDGENIDIRLRLPTGEDYIVVSKKQIELLPIADTFSDSTMYLKLGDIEIATLSNAVVEASMIEGAYLYADKYVEAGMQEKAKITYYPSGAVLNAINENDNLTVEARTKLIDRYNMYYRSVRERIEGNMTEDAWDNVRESIEEEVATKQEQRKQYLESLAY